MTSHSVIVDAVRHNNQPYYRMMGDHHYIDVAHMASFDSATGRWELADPWMVGITYGVSLYDPKKHQLARSDEEDVEHEAMIIRDVCVLAALPYYQVSVGHAVPP